MTRDWPTDPDEAEKCRLDMLAYGFACHKDGKRVDPTEVFVQPPHLIPLASKPVPRD